VNNSFNPFEFVEFARQRLSTVAAVVACALLAALILSFVLPNRYTATASIMIEPPGGSDPRISTSVSPVYLESLKTYEQFASSDTLFAQACDKFRLLSAEGSPAIEAFKKRVLAVRKPKETKLLQIAVTLGDPKLAQALVQYLAEQTVSLSNTVSADSEGRIAQQARARAETARAALAKTHTDLTAAASVGQQTSLQAELEALAKLQSEIGADIAATRGRIAEYAARESRSERANAELEFIREELAALRAKADALEISRSSVALDIAQKSGRLSQLQARREQLHAALRAAQNDFDLATKRLAEVEAASGMRAEQLRIIDPGIVPQRPSSPNLPLNCAAAFVLGTVAAFVYLGMTFGLERQRARYARSSFKVAQRDSA
jgi:capsular polysaccharide biosynthesis protein